MEKRNYFTQLYLNGRLSHAYAFSGNNTSEKEQVTEHIAGLLACSNKQPDGNPCGMCSECKRIASHLYPDIQLIEPDGRTIRVDQIRSLKQWLATTPVEGVFKFAIISQAEKMNTAASNALLKAIEEPAQNTYFVLWVQEMSQLLPTIQSRVQHLSFSSNNNLLKQEMLISQGYNSTQAMILSHLLSEHMDEFLNRYSSEDFNRWEEDFVYFYRTLLSKQMTAFLIVSTHLKAHLESVQLANIGIDYLLLLNYYLLLSLSNDKQQLKETRYMSLFNNINKEIRPSFSDIFSIHQLLNETKQMIEANVSPILALEQLVIKISAKGDMNETSRYARTNRQSGK